MKSEILHFFSRWKRVLTLCCALSISLLSRGQSETHDFITYDTTIHIQPEVGNQYYFTDWNVRISRPANMFTANHPDTASRPVLLTMPGQGEQNSSDTANLTKYGPHYWLKSGWNGGITLANGTHYPILITVACTSTLYPNGQNMTALIQFLTDHYHIKKNSVHVGGLSQGGFTFTSVICFEQTAGAETGMKLVSSVVALQGFNMEQDGAYNNWNRRAVAYGVWAKKYHGKLFGLQGTTDADRNIATGEKGMNDSLPGSAYFAYENIGGGAHCCWNTMYDPTVTNWQSFSPYGTYITTGTDTNSRGTYKIGSSVFQWMLRQGDTALVGGGSPGGGGTGNVEAHDFITYDTTVHIQPDPGNQYYYTDWNVRISRPANMFTVNNADTASRPVLLTMPGYAEQGNSDTNNLTKHGPHYWLQHGWDGGITLGNGTHYPILITVACTSTLYPNGENMTALIKFFTDHYHIKKSAVHLGGLTQGAITMTAVIPYEQSAGAETGMKQVTSIVALQGFNMEQDGAPNSWNRRKAAYGVWAKKYHGHFFGLQGSSDVDRNVATGEKAMNDSLSGSAYFAYENMQGGGACCYDSMYNPAVTNWQSYSPYGTYVTTGVDTNSRGSYKTGSSIFQWMLRQGDTALVNPTSTGGGGSPGGSAGIFVKKVIVAEYTTWYIRNDSSIYAYNNGSSFPVQWSIGTRKAITGAGGFNFFRVIDDQGYIWTSRTGGTAISDRQDTDTTGSAFNGNIFVDAYANTAVSIRSDHSVWYWGKDSYNLFYTGGQLAAAATGTNMKPTQLSPAGMQFKKVLLGGNRIVGLTTAGDVYVWLPNGSRTPTQMTIPRAAVDIFVSHLDVAGCIIPDAGQTSGLGYPYVWGTTTSMYGGGTAFTQPTSLKTLWGMTVPVKEIAVNWNTIHFIDSLGRLFGCGFNSMGEVGNGQDFVNKYNYPGFPGYGWSFTDYENPSGIPTQIGTGTTWAHLYSNNWFAFYKYAQDANDSIYSWGRNKSLVLGNGYYNNQEATSYDAMDVLQPTMVHPLVARYQAYNFTAPTLNAGTDQSISTTSTTLSASGHPALVLHAGTLVNGVDSVGYHWVSFQWTKVSGPACTITSPTAQSTTITGMTNGTYKFRVLATDNNTGTTVDTVQVTVATGALHTPAVTAGSSTNLSIDDAGAAGERFLIYPTVTHESETVTMAINSSSMGPVKIRIFDASGKVLQTIQAEKRGVYFNQTLRINSLPAGVYVVQALVGNGQRFTGKLIRL